MLVSHLVMMMTLMMTMTLMIMNILIMMITMMKTPSIISSQDDNAFYDDGFESSSMIDAN